MPSGDALDQLREELVTGLGALSSLAAEGGILDVRPQVGSDGDVVILFSRPPEPCTYGYRWGSVLDGHQDAGQPPASIASTVIANFSERVLAWSGDARDEDSEPPEPASPGSDRSGVVTAVVLPFRWNTVTMPVLPLSGRALRLRGRFLRQTQDPLGDDRP
jgi:hypothetical protein